jgi:cytochrome d ubiquinol oxidase subunit II
MLGIIGTAGISMFPFIMPSSSDPRSSLTVWDSVSSQLTLMFWTTLIFLPLIILYASWAYSKMSGKITEAFIDANDKSAY